MYSRRRKLYRYQSKKYYRNNLFAPSLRKATSPNYYQMKGRIIQQSPLNMKDPNTFIMTRDKLDEYYNILKQYKYVIPQPITPDLSAYNTLVSLPYSLSEIITQYGILVNFDTEWLIAASNIYLNDSLPSPPSGFIWKFSCLNIDFVRNGLNTTDSTRYSLVFNSPNFLTDNQFPIIDKDADMGPYSVNSHAHITCKRTGVANQAEITEITYAQYSLGISSVEVSTTDPNINDNGWYPLITNDESASTYNSSITFNSTQTGSIYDRTYLTFNVLVFLDKS